MVFSFLFEYPGFRWCLRLGIFSTSVLCMLLTGRQHPITSHYFACKFPKQSATIKPVLNPDMGFLQYCCRLPLKCDGIGAEIRFRLSSKRTSPFKSAGASVQSTPGSRDVRISGSITGYTKFRGSVKRCVGDGLSTPFASFPVTSTPVRHRVLSHFKRSLPRIHMIQHVRGHQCIAGPIPYGLQLQALVTLASLGSCHKSNECTNSCAHRSVCFCSQSGGGASVRLLT